MIESAPPVHNINERRIGIDPIGKPRMTRSDRWKERDCVLAYWAYKDELRLKLPGYQLPDELSIVFYLPMPDSWSNKKKRELVGLPHRQKPDIDNLLKAFMDALADDDTHVWNVHARKLWGDRGEIILYESA